MSKKGYCGVKGAANYINEELLSLVGESPECCELYVLEWIFSDALPAIKRNGHYWVRYGHLDQLIGLLVKANRDISTLSQDEADLLEIFFPPLPGAE